MFTHSFFFLFLLLLFFQSGGPAWKINSPGKQKDKSECVFLVKASLYYSPFVGTFAFNGAGVPTK